MILYIISCVRAVRYNQYAGTTTIIILFHLVIIRDFRDLDEAICLVADNRIIFCLRPGLAYSDKCLNVCIGQEALLSNAVLQQALVLAGLAIMDHNIKLVNDARFAVFLCQTAVHIASISV